MIVLRCTKVTLLSKYDNTDYRLEVLYARSLWFLAIAPLTVVDGRRSHNVIGPVQFYKYNLGHKY